MGQLSSLLRRGTLNGQPAMLVAAADAVLHLLKIDDAVGVLNNRTGGRTRLSDSGSSQCMQPSLRISHSSLPFCSVSLSASPSDFCAQVRRVIVHPDAMPHLVADVVPLGTGHLAGFAAPQEETSISLATSAL